MSSPMGPLSAGEKVNKDLEPRREGGRRAHTGDGNDSMIRPQQQMKQTLPLMWPHFFQDYLSLLLLLKWSEHLCQSCSQSSAHICVNIICSFCRIHFTVTSVQRRRIKGKNPNASTTFCQVLIYCYCSCNIRGHTEARLFAG